MFTETMMESIKKVEATRAARMGTEPRRMSAQEKEELLFLNLKEAAELGIRLNLKTVLPCF